MKPATILAIHRGYTITDELYGTEPFTIYSPEGKVIDHSDEETIKECITTIDIIQDEIEAQERQLEENRWTAGACFDKSYPENYSNIRA